MQAALHSVLMDHDGSYIDITPAPWGYTGIICLEPKATTQSVYDWLSKHRVSRGTFYNIVSGVSSRESVMGQGRGVHFHKWAKKLAIRRL